MTTAKFLLETDGWSIEINEHAGDSKVCAACSALSCALINALREAYEYREISRLNVTVEPGKVYISSEAKPSHIAYVDGIISTIKIGFKALAENYPDNVQVLIKDA